ncbi:MAG: hypothetical protein E7421_01825 [Ruminococcaceae bacterium]|nr:hypothetical protein [Oscillospiraceae bacterium]
MKRYLEDLCNAVDIDKVTDLDLLALSEQCAILEEQVYAMLDRLSYGDQALLQDYITTRNDLECEALNAALRWGMQHPK